MRSPIRALTLAAAAPLVVLALAACTTTGSLPSLPSSTTTPTPTPTVAQGPAATAIAALALRTVGEGTVVAVEDAAAGTEWDVRVVQDDGTLQELRLADDGAVVAGPSADTTDANEQSRNRAQVAASTITLGGAYRRMLAAVPGGTVTAIELDTVGDGVVWRGDVLAAGVRHDVRIDAVSGAVVMNRPDATPTPPSGS